MTETTNNLSRAAIKALAVDDENISRDILKMMLEHQGYVVDAANNGKAALSLWQQEKHDVVITDCQMPNMDGFELTKAIRKIEVQTQSPKCTIIALTATDGDIEEQRCLEAGMDTMLSKPVNSEKLKTILAYQPNNTKRNKESLSTCLNERAPKQHVIDYETLSQVFPDKNRQYLMLSALQQHLQVALIELNQHIENTNTTSVEAVVHRMKGACKMVGVNQIAVSCDAIEQGAHQGQLPKQALLDQLNSHIAQFNALMTHEVTRLATQASTRLGKNMKGLK